MPRYAWLKSPIPEGVPYTFDNARGTGAYSPDRVFVVAKLDGAPLPQEEIAVLLAPGEQAVFDLFVPHQPVSADRAAHLAGQEWTERHDEIVAYWREKLDRAAKIAVPEPRINEMIQAGLLHLDLVTYGIEPDQTAAPTIGVYSPIGSESSPIVQYMDSVGWHDLARRSLGYFLDKQHDDGFIQNFNGYMLETGAALWSIGEHYRYTHDDAWLRTIAPKVLKSADYLLRWRDRNCREELRGRGYGLLEGKTADPEDPFRSFMLNGYAYLGLSRVSEILHDIEPEQAQRIGAEAVALKADIRTALAESMAAAPVVPLGDGTWCPTAPPWVAEHGPLVLFEDGKNWLTHGTVATRDSLLGPLWLVTQEVLEPDEPTTTHLLQFHNELMCTHNVAFSQPYYSPHPFVHLLRGEPKPFIEAFYHTLAGLADRETYSFWEHYFHASPHKTHEEAWFLMQTRWMLYLERGEDLHLLSGVPRAWLADGARIAVQGAATHFGPLDFEVRSDLSAGHITAHIHCAERPPSRVRLRVPHPDGVHPTRVEGGTYIKEIETVIVDPWNGEASVVLHYAT